MVRRESKGISPALRNLVAIGALVTLGLCVFAVAYLLFSISFYIRTHPVTSISENCIVLSFGYFSDKPVVAELYGPDNRLLHSTTLEPGDRTATLQMAQPFEAPRPGGYLVRIHHLRGVLFESPLYFHGGAVEVEEVGTVWKWSWSENRNLMVRMRLKLTSYGDLPAYVDRVRVAIGAENLGTFKVGRWFKAAPDWLKAGETWYLEVEGLRTPPLEPMAYVLSINAFDSKGNWVGGTFRFPEHYTLDLLGVPVGPVLEYEEYERWSGKIEWQSVPGAPPRWYLYDWVILSKVKSKLWAWTEMGVVRFGGD